jgi:hypothetical protein
VLAELHLNGRRRELKQQQPTAYLNEFEGKTNGETCAQSPEARLGVGGSS